MTVARARSLWLAAPALLAACSSAPSAQPSSTPPLPLATESIEPATLAATVAPTSAPTSSSVVPVTTLVPIDPALLIPIAIGNKPFPAAADALATKHHGYTGDPNATLQQWLIMPMAVPSGPDVRLLGFERTVGISTTTATFLTGSIDPPAVLTTIQAALAPSPTYAVTASTRTAGTVTIHGFDAQPTTVQGDPPGWSVEASSVDQLGIVRIKRSDYTFAKVVPTFSDMPTGLQAEVRNQDAIAVTIGGSLTSIAYEYGVESLGDSPRHRTRLSYDLSHDFAAATVDLKARLTIGWDISEQPEALNFTSTTTSEVWTLDEIGGSTHLTYDTGSGYVVPNPKATRLMRHLLAGGCGFVGSHLAELLLARGDEVVAIDNFATGRRSNIAHLASDDRFVLIEHDITKPLPDLDAKFDAVLDLASPASPTDFATMPLEILAVGSTGTRNLLDLAVVHGARFFLASTSEVYGDPQVHPQPESYWGNVSSIGPRSCYDEAKRFSEAITMAYHRVHGLDVRIARIFNTYGERMRPDDGRVVNTLVVQALRGEPITLHGDGSQTRSFCHVADEIVGLTAVLDGHLTGPINVGNPTEFTIRQLADLVVGITGSTSEIITVPLPPEREGDPAQRCPDISLISGAYGWKPAIALEDGLTRMIEWFRTAEGIG